MLNELAAVLPLKQHTPRTIGRQVILVDIENLVGGAVMTASSAHWARTQLEAVTEISPDAHVIIGTSHIGLFPTRDVWPGKQYLIQSGPDGADLALLEAIDDLLVNRYDEVVLASGDGIFADAVSRLTAHGLDVTVVAHHGRCAARLRMAAHRTIYMQNNHYLGTHGGAA